MALGVVSSTPAATGSSGMMSMLLSAEPIVSMKSAAIPKSEREERDGGRGREREGEGNDGHKSCHFT